MSHSNQMAHQLAITLLEALYVKNPTLEQCKAAESFVTAVILALDEKGAAQERLTEKEWFCLNLAASGFSIEETAKQLSLKINTVKNYRERIRQKLHCKTITHAVYKVFALSEENITD